MDSPQHQPTADAPEPNRAEPTLADLINLRKGKRSYADLSRDAGGYPTRNRFQQLATVPDQSRFPDPETLRGVARTLAAPMSEVVLAAARTVGLPVPPADPNILVIAGVGDLPQEARDLILDMARDMIRTWGAVGGHGRRAAGPEEPDPPAVAALN